MNIITRLAAHASALPDASAFVILNNGEDIGQTISYASLQQKVRALASLLKCKQLEGKRVLLAYQDIPEFIISFLACQYSGIVAVPVSYPKGNKQVARLFAIFDDARASAVLCTSDAVAALQETLPVAIEIITTDIDLSSGGPASDIKPVSNEIAFIQYTSGSTGKPKGVVVSAGNLWHNQQLLEDTFGCNKDSVILSWLPFHHDMGLIGNILHSIYVGCSCIMMSPLHFMQRPARWLEGISRYKATHSGGPNFAYDLVVQKVPESELIKLDLSAWTVAYNGSEPIRPETLERFSNHFKPAGFQHTAFSPCYGLAEATLLVSGNKKAPSPAIIFIGRELCADGKVILSDASNPQAISIVSSGSAAPGMECKIIAVADQHECAELEEGEICIAGESVTSGYWGKENNDIFYRFGDKAFLKTGDLGFIHEGSLFVHGRLKEMLIIRGKNFYPYDIEDVAAGSEDSIETNGVAAFSIADPAENFVIVAEIKRSLLKSVQAGNVIHSIHKAVVASFGISPYDIVLTTPLGIPRTTSGKLQRVKCKDAYTQNLFNVIASGLQLAETSLRIKKNAVFLQEAVSKADYASIRRYLVNVIESKLGSIGDVLPDDAVELTATGLDSLRAMELINAINKDLSINIDASKAFQVNTLAGLINTIESMLWLKNKQPFGSEITI